MPDHPTLVFVRHGETDWNAEDRLQGQKDIPLNDRGRAQARRNGETLLAQFPDIAGYDFVSSPLSRTRETMEIVRVALGLDPASYRLDERLLEITFGDWEGFTIEELRATNPDSIAAREADKWMFRPPRGESYHLLAGRVGGWLGELERPTVAIAHGGVGRVVRHRLLGLGQRESAAMNCPQDRVLHLKDGQEAWI
ncbi:histidine phosphatase family protein [Bauldia sp.]|uniref:histidine phosphatase family protein n=1 Tax=Bauldia sp. TaxID=2575872 RepID=UPI003BAD4117